MNLSYSSLMPFFCSMHVLFGYMFIQICKLVAYNNPPIVKVMS
jgi:hypothetical protein